MDRVRMVLAYIGAGSIAITLMTLPVWMWIELIRWASKGCG